MKQILTVQQKARISYEYLSKAKTQKELAKEYNVSQSTISNNIKWFCMDAYRLSFTVDENAYAKANSITLDELKLIVSHGKNIVHKF